MLRFFDSYSEQLRLIEQGGIRQLPNFKAERRDIGHGLTRMKHGLEA